MAVSSASSPPADPSRMSYLPPLLITMAVLIIGWRFAVFDGLASFADDSVSYLVIARHLTPFGPHDPLMAEASEAVAYPPMFPLLLALTGTAHDFSASHAVVLACLGGASFAFWAWVRRESRSPTVAAVLAVLWLSAPFVWTQLLGILSENLYLLLVFPALMAGDSLLRADASPRCRWIGFALLAAAVLMTRSVGISLIIAYALLRFGPRWRTPAELRGVDPWLPVILPLIVLLSWEWVHPVLTQTYGTELVASLGGSRTAGSGLAAEAFHLALPQLSALLDAWRSHLIIYWLDPLAARTVLAAGLGALALAGLLQGLFRRSLAAWYAAIYLLVIVIWPHPGQMTRFLYPLFPLLLYFGYGFVHGLGGRLLGGRAKGWPLLLYGLLSASLTVPALSFIHSRAQVPPDGKFDYRRNTEFYLVPDLASAEGKSRQHLRLFQDMRRIHRTTPEGARILWFSPAYLNLLAERRGVAFPNTRDPGEFRRQIYQTGAKLLFVSELIPHRTSDDGRRLLAAVSGFTKPLWIDYDAKGKLFSALLHIDDQKLTRSVSGPLPTTDRRTDAGLRLSR